MYLFLSLYNLEMYKYIYHVNLNMKFDFHLHIPTNYTNIKILKIASTIFEMNHKYEY